MGEARYVIRTTAGDRGPFSSGQIRAFIDGGKLPGTARIFDQMTGAPVSAADAAQADETVVAAEVVMPEPEPAPSRSGTARHGGPGGRTGTRSVRRTGGARATTSRHRRDERPARRLPMLTLILGGVGVLAVGIVLFLVLRGGGSDPEARLVGTWHLDVDTLMAQKKAKQGPAGNPEQEAMQRVAEGMLRGMASMVRMEFRRDGTARLPMDDQDGRWAVTNVRGDRFTLSTTDSKDKKVTVEARFEGDRLHLEKDGEPMVMMRAKR